MQPGLQPRPAVPPVETVEGPRSSENLALLYQELLTGIVRLQAGQVHTDDGRRRKHIDDGELFRRRTKAQLKEIERDAVAAGYDREDVRDTHFAVVAFLDAVILHTNDPVRAEWERKSLQQDLFGQADAGVVFFEKLERFVARRDSERLADILEVYLLCLLLGFEGRYSGGMRGELEATAEKIRMRIDDIRGRSEQISPSGGLPDVTAQAGTAATPTPQFRPIAMVTLGVIGFTVILFILLRVNLSSASDQVRRVLGLP